MFKFKFKCFIYPTEVHDIIYNLYVVHFWRESGQRNIAYRAVHHMCPVHAHGYLAMSSKKNGRYMRNISSHRLTHCTVTAPISQDWDVMAQWYMLSVSNLHILMLAIWFGTTPISSAHKHNDSEIHWQLFWYKNKQSLNWSKIQLYITPTILNVSGRY